MEIWSNYSATYRFPPNGGLVREIPENFREIQAGEILFHLARWKFSKMGISESKHCNCKKLPVVFGCYASTDLLPGRGQFIGAKPGLVLPKFYHWKGKMWDLFSVKAYFLDFEIMLFMFLFPRFSCVINH